ncbi:MAG: hypothetical protein NVS9B13_16520 [Candidatus Acidiferrum sp.]
MSHPRVLMERMRKHFLFFPIITFLFAHGSAAQESKNKITCPNSEMGRLACEAVRQLNTSTPTEIKSWAASVLSSKSTPEDRAEFLKMLLTAREESDGVELVAAREGRAPGTAVVTLRAKRVPARMELILFPDPAEPNKIGRFAAFPAEDPEFYANWPTAKSSEEQLAATVRSKLRQLVKSRDFSGCVNVSKNDHAIFEECVGLAERSFQVAIGRDTKFHLGSMDKMFTAVAIAQLVESGKLSYESTLAKTVPEYANREAAEKISVWQLLHHTSGLGDFFVPEFFEHREKFVNPSDYLELIARQPMVGQPDEGMFYSNAGFVLLGRIVEKVSGENYFDYVHKHIFVPAGMATTGFDSVEEVTPKLAVGYMRDDPFAIGAWHANWMTLPFKGSPAGGGYSTTGDLILFSRALRSGKLLSSSSLSRMFEKEVEVRVNESYAAGFEDKVVARHHIRGHNGGAPGMNAELAMIWESGYAVAITSNEDGPAAQEFADHVADLLAKE